MPTTNSGVTMRLLPITSFTFSGLGANAGMTIAIAQHIDVTSYTEAHVLFRYHAGTTFTASTTQKLQAAVYADGWDFEDPATLFGQFLAQGAALNPPSPGATLQVIPVGLAAGSTLEIGRAHV